MGVGMGGIGGSEVGIKAACERTCFLGRLESRCSLSPHRGRWQQERCHNEKGEPLARTVGRSPDFGCFRSLEKDPKRGGLVDSELAQEWTKTASGVSSVGFLFDWGRKGVPNR